MKIKNNSEKHSKSSITNGDVDFMPISNPLKAGCSTNQEESSHSSNTRRKKSRTDHHFNAVEPLDTNLSKTNGMIDSTIEDDQAESVDSGCVSDLTQESSWDQIREALSYEYNFVSGLLGHTPLHKKESLSLTTSDKDLSSSITDINKQKKKLREELVQLKESESSSKFPKKQQEAKIKKNLLALEKCRGRLIAKEKRRKRVIATPLSSEMSTSSEEARKIYTKCGKLVFSKFDFSDTVKEKWGQERDRKKDLNYYLSKVLKEKEKVKSLKKTGRVNDAAEMIERKRWNLATKKLNGEKVKDDAEKIAKSLQRKLNKKKKSSHKWCDREMSVQKAKEERQEKRKRNLDARKMKKSLKKLKSKSKKGKKDKRVPGF